MPLTGEGLRAMGWESALRCADQKSVFPRKAMEAFIHSLIHSFSEYSPRACSVPRTVLSSGDRVTNNNQIPAVAELTF